MANRVSRYYTHERRENSGLLGRPATGNLNAHVSRWRGHFGRKCTALTGGAAVVQASIEMYLLWKGGGSPKGLSSVIAIINRVIPVIKKIGITNWQKYAASMLPVITQFAGGSERTNRSG